MKPPVRSAPVALGLLLVTAALLASPGHPATATASFNVDTTLDNPALHNCSAAANDCSLRGAVGRANGTPGVDTIELQPGQTYVLDEPGVEYENISGSIDILEDVVIHGNGAAISANGIDRPMAVNTASTTAGVEIDDLTLTGGHDEFDGAGGGLRIIQGDVTLDGVTVTNNQTVGSGGGILVDQGADLNLLDTTVSHNTADNDGGGIAVLRDSGSLDIADSLIEGNTAREGGGLYVDESTSVAIANTAITGNSATFECGSNACQNGGGGINARQQSVTITGGEITGNHASASGGGIVSSTFGGQVLSIAGTVIRNNTAFWDAGGVYARNATITDATISGNQAQNAAGLDLLAATLSRTTVSGNTATDSAGGIRIADAATIDHSTISGNTTAGSGGGLMVIAGAQTVTNSTISGNAASEGAGIWKGQKDQAQVVIQGDAGPGTLSLSHVTVAANTGGSGANVFNTGAYGAIETRASIFADPAGGPGCNSALTSLDFNVETGDDCGLNAAHDETTADAGLLALADNGGGTMTHALGPDSVAIDLVSSGCPPPADDQRGLARPRGTACDAGAFEFDPGAFSKVWGDNDCGADIDANDAIVLLIHAAAVPGEPQGCFPAIAQSVQVNLQARPWGDVNCDAVVDPLDALFVLLYMADVPGEPQLPCPPMGHAVTVTG